MSSSEEKIDELLERWETLREEGKQVPIHQLTSDPMLASALQDRIRRIEAMDWLEADQATVSLTEVIDTEKSQQSCFDACVPWMFANRYVLNSLIASGGFGQVWKAWDRRLERTVAVKISQMDNSAEARRVAQLQHPGIVAVHDLGSEQGLWYIVFDLVEGIDLARRMEVDPPDWREGTRIVAAVAGYLDYAHAKGFVHRDVKPANILLKGDGTPVLADFGIAITEVDLAGETTTTAGTLAYMAPELLTGEGKADACTDVYGLGVVLFEILNHRLPFEGRHFWELRQRILSGEPPEWSCDQCPPALREITLRCLSKDPDMRYQSAHALGEELRNLLAA